jgi:hypothetical protein
MRKLIWRTLLLLLVVTLALPLLAQDSGGQLWVQAFEDRNGNGQHDAGEPFLTQNVSVDLLNADGVVVARGSLDGAPYASRGYVGFLYLDPGAYTAVITSPELTPTTPDHVAVTITAGALPVTVLYGAQRAAVASTTDGAASSLLNSELARVALSGFVALVVVGIMIVIGMLIYTLVLRRHFQAEMKRYTTTSMRAVRVGQTGELRTAARGNARGYETAEPENDEV